MSKSLEALEMKALSGDLEAQVTLGEMYYHGKLVKKNHDTAYKWFRKACQKGHALAKRYSVQIEQSMI